MSKICLVCEVSKYEIEQFRKARGKVMPCITKNERHIYKKRRKMPKIHPNQLEFIQT